ncbi:MAG: hypothetical protein PF961_18660 [Planctomycetota bacterium]|nr:hypothetical protein [Planctomycetota bacterium]
MRCEALQVDFSQPPWALAAPVVAGLTAAGHVVVFVGGCVRDHLLGRPITDLDLATDASPDQVEALFERCVTVGKQFGVTVVLVPGGEVEVATFRSDEAYIDGRRPTGVVTATEEVDVERRDFTCNALVLDPVRKQLRDHVGGLADIEAKCLRVVGDPKARLEEDRLRVLRGLRFAAHLGFTIEPATEQALRSVATTGLSRERIWEEWRKGVSDPCRSRWVCLVNELGLGSVLSPLLATADLPSLDHLPADCPSLSALAATLAATEPEALAAWLKTEPISREWRRDLPWLVCHQHPATWDSSLAERRAKLLAPAAASLMPLLVNREDWPQAANLHAEFTHLSAHRPQPYLTGADLIALGVAPGPQLGEILAALWKAQLAGEISDFSTAKEHAVALAGL